MARDVLGTELPTGYPREIEFNLRREETLENMHAVAEMRIWPFALQHKVLIGVGREVLGGGTTVSVVNAMDLGAATYEAVVGYLPDIADYETPSYDDAMAQMLAVRGINEFMAYVDMDEDALKDRLTYAARRMETDAPQLDGVVSGVVEKYLHESVLQQYASFGAAAMRGFHILLDRRIMRGDAYVDEADVDNELRQLIKANEA
jgi:hypothetical protein